MNVGMKVEGLRELDRALNAIPLRSRGPILRGALNAAANPMLATARKLSGVRAPTRKIGKHATNPRIKNNYTAEVRIGPKKDAWYLRFWETGTSTHKIRARRASILTDKVTIFGKEVDHPGIQPRPFLRPAFDSEHRSFIRIFRDEMRRRILLRAAR